MTKNYIKYLFILVLTYYYNDALNAYIRLRQ